MGRILPLLLIDQKTKQRYPLQGDFVIGRSQGDLVFDHDPKLSGKHCLIRSTPEGAAIYDLKSRTGVFVNGVPLRNGKACTLKAGLRVTLGDQKFEVGEDRRSMRTEVHSIKLYGAALSVVSVLAAIAIFFPPKSIASQRPTASRPQDAASLSRDLREAVSELHRLEAAERARTLSREIAIEQLKQQLIPKFESLHDQLQAATLKVPVPLPAHANPRALEKAKEFERRLSGLSLGQASALANYLETGDAKYAGELEEYRRALVSLDN